MRNREEVKSLKWKVGDRKMTNLKIYDKVLKLRMFIRYTSLQKDNQRTNDIFNFAFSHKP